MKMSSNDSLIKPKANRNQLRSEATRSTILNTARETFINKGYYQSTVDELIELSNVSKGAFYHHFQGKSDAFLAVYVQLHEEIAEAARESAKHPDPWKALVATFDRYFLAVSQPLVYRFLLLDSKSVLTRAKQLEIDNLYGNAVVSEVVQRAIVAGCLSRRLEPNTSVIVGGVVDSLVDWCAYQPNPTDFLKVAREKFMIFLEMLREADGDPNNTNTLRPDRSHARMKRQD